MVKSELLYNIVFFQSEDALQCSINKLNTYKFIEEKYLFCKFIKNKRKNQKDLIKIIKNLH